VANKISVVIEATADKAVASLKNFRTSIAEADGAAGKMKAGFASASSAIQANAGAIAIGAGTALISFGVKAVGQFQELALAVGQFSAATGVSTEASSRWIEVASSIGIEADSVQGALQKMNKAVADGKDVFTDYGIQIVRTKDGLVDSNATFQNALTTIGAIKDPTLRAKAAQETFGRSYADVSRLMQMSAGDLKKALADVSDGQVITDDERRNAEAFREALDTLRDRVDAFTNTVGGDLVPILTDVADVIENVVKVADKLPIDKVNEFFLKFGTGFGLVDKVNETWNAFFGSDKPAEDLTTTGTAADGLTDALDDTATKMDEVRSSTVAAKRAAEDMKNEWSGLKGEVNDQKAWLNLQDQFDEIRQKSQDAFYAAAAGAADAEEKQRGYQSSILDAKSAIIDYGQTVLGLPAEKVTSIIANVQNVDDVERTLAILTRNRQMEVSIIAKGGIGFGVGARAAGGPVDAGMPYLVGEQGPELVVPRGNGTVIPAGKTAGMLSGGNSNITVNLYTNADPNSTKAALRLFNRRNGPGL